MELTFFAALAGVAGSAVLAAMWAGVSLLAGIPMPSADQVVGMMLIGPCALVLVGWAVAILNP